MRVTLISSEEQCAQNWMSQGRSIRHWLIGFWVLMYDGKARRVLTTTERWGALFSKNYLCDNRILYEIHAWPFLNIFIYHCNRKFSINFIFGSKNRFYLESLGKREEGRSKGGKEWERQRYRVRERESLQ